MKVNLMWDWADFGIMLRVFKNSKHGNYHMSIDIQIAWLNIWIGTFKKK